MPKITLKAKLALVKARLKSIDQNLSEEQIDFILNPISNPCYLKACPGSGKTEVVGIKAAYEIADWDEKFTGIAILSFTKNAAKEISKRVEKVGGPNSTGHPHFIGTIDSWLHNYILHPFGHKATNYKGVNIDKSYRLVDNEERYDFLSSFETVLSTNPFKSIAVNNYYCECTDPIKIQSQSRTLDLSKVSRTKLDLLKENKKKFLKAGLATYADAEFICFYLLEKNPTILQSVVKRFPYIIIDECQDLSNNQLAILDLLINNGVIMTFVGDNNQSIYEFKKVYASNIEAFIVKHKMSEKLLTKNFRSNQQIVNVSMALEKYNTEKAPKKIIGTQDQIVEKCCVIWEYTNANLSMLPQKFIDFIKDINSKSEKKISLQKSAVLARAHTTLSLFKSNPSSSLNKIELFANSLICWANNPRTGKDLQNSLQQIGKSISMLAYNGKGNHQHQYCPEFYTQIEWRFQLSDLISHATNVTKGIYPIDKLTWSEWVKKLKIFLSTYWSNLRSPTNDWSSVKSKIKAPTGKASKLVSDTLNLKGNSYSEKLRMTTFHDIKGETLDAVLVMSSPTGHSQGGYYEHWLTNKNDKKEHIRFGYVASSRPKHLLIWAIPKKENNTFLPKILNLGFEEE